MHLMRTIEEDEMTLTYTSSLDLVTPAEDQSIAWWPAVCDALGDLSNRLALDDCAAGSPFGVFQEAVEREPLLGHEAQRLLADRDRLAEWAGRLIRLVARGPWDEASAAAVVSELPALAAAEGRYREESWILFWDSVDPPWNTLTPGQCCH